MVHDPRFVAHVPTPGRLVVRDLVISGSKNTKPARLQPCGPRNL